MAVVAAMMPHYEVPAMLPRALSVACVALGLLISGHAQGFAPRQRKKPPEIPMDSFSAEGTVQAVAPGRIQILTNSNQTWLIWVDPKAKIRVTGTAKADFLRTGMFVRYTAEVDGRGQAREKVAELTLITPSQRTPLGAWPEGAGDETEEAANDTGSSTARGKRPAFAVYTIAGRITNLRKGRLSVHAGVGVFRCELAKEPRIKVDFADYTVAQKNNRISIIKGKMPRGTFGIAQASELTIELAEPLTLVRKRPVKAKRTTPKRSSRAPKEADGKQESVGTTGRRRSSRWPEIGPKATGSGVDIAV